jgi:YidC/Oxa1 family membrane protein insertase
MYLIYSLVDNYGIALIIFTLVAKLLISPLAVNQQKTTAKQKAINPKLEKLRKSFANNPQKLQEEQMKLYQENNINPMAGCLPLILQFAVLYGILDVVYRPLTHILRISKDTLTQAQNILTSYLSQQGITEKYLSSRPELIIMQYAKKNPDIFSEIQGFSQQIQDFNNTLFGLIDLGVTPTIHPEVWNASAVALLMIPIASGVFQLILTIYTQIRQKKDNPEAAKMMGGMNIMLYMMPLFSVWIAFGFPAGVGFYWTLSSVFSLIQTIIINAVMTPERVSSMLAKEKARAKNKKPGLMEKMMEKQNDMLQAQSSRNSSDMSKSELSEYQRQLINEARKRMADKYGDDNNKD